MERKEIELTNEEWCTLVYEEYFKEEKADIVENKYVDSGRHTEYHYLIFKTNEEYYKVEYETSVKDEMGWNECNYGDTKAIQVFPEIIKTIIFN